MPQIALRRLGQRALVLSLTLAALALLGVVLAYWTWAWFAPRSEPRLQVASIDTGSTAAAGTLFGRAVGEVAVKTGIAIRLLGVVAASGGRKGNAVVQVDGRQILAVSEGGDIEPGVRLAEVHADHVILERGGTREILTLPEPHASLPASPVATGK